MNKDIVTEGDTCPECEDYKVEVESWQPFYLHCPNCGARWNDRGERVPCKNASTTKTAEDLIKYYTDKGLTRGQALQSIKQVVDRASKGIILRGTGDEQRRDRKNTD